MLGGICVSLGEFAKDEGDKASIDKAERWRDCLEEMAEIANKEQLGHICPLLSAVKMHLRLATK